MQVIFSSNVRKATYRGYSYICVQQEGPKERCAEDLFPCVLVLSPISLVPKCPLAMRGMVLGRSWKIQEQGSFTHEGRPHTQE